MASDASAAGARILLVEDEVAIRRATTAALEALGHTVSAAPELEAAQTLLKQKTFDLALVDLNLRGGHGGFVLMRFVRAEGLDLPMIVISSTTDHEDILAAFRLGVDDFVQKPVRVSELTCVVGRILKKHRGAANGSAPGEGAPAEASPEAPATAEGAA